MIKFFRHIRRSLVRENKMGKYFKYAIGEIVLVVIGILIALQINNWNEDKKLIKQEIKALREIREGFKADTLDLSINIMALRKASSSGLLLLNELNSNRPYHDSLSRHFSSSIIYTRLISNDGPYEVLKVKGLDLISNDSLRKRIINMHDNSYQSLRTWEPGFFVSDRYIHEQLIDWFDVVMAFDMGPNGYKDGKMVPHNYESLKANKRYKTMLKTFATQSRLFLGYTQNIKSKLKVLIQDIDKELTFLDQ